MDQGTKEEGEGAMAEAEGGNGVPIYDLGLAPLPPSSSPLGEKRYTMAQMVSMALVMREAQYAALSGYSEMETCVSV